MAIIHRFTGNQQQYDYQWEGVPAQSSPMPEVSNFVKHVLVGPADGAGNFVIRYFQLPVGGASPLHSHAHEHGIVIIHGKGKLQINQEHYDVAPLDAILIPGGELHQISNAGDEPMGFFCTIIRSAEG